MPFEWAGAMPDSWGGAEDGGTDPDDPAEPPAAPPADEPAAQVLTVVGESFTLAWDADTTDVAGFRVYWRAHGDSEWNVLEESVAETELTVTTAELAHGSYEFAVTSLATDGTESSMHHSFDPTADPQPWYLEWVG